MKLLYKTLLTLTILFSATVNAQLKIENVGNNEPTALLNIERNYIVVTNSPETFIPRGDINNWTVTGGVITNFNITTDAITVRWTTVGEGYLKYIGLQEWESGTVDDPTPQTFQKIEITDKTIPVKDPNDVSNYFDESITYTSCNTAYLKTRGDIPSTQQWFWQLTPDDTSKDLKVNSIIIDEEGSNGDTVYLTQGISVSKSGSYYIRFYTTSDHTWSPAKRLDVDFNNTPSHISRIEWYTDTDNDGFGDANSTPIIACSQPDGYIDNKLDACPTVKGKNQGCPTDNYRKPLLSDGENYIYSATPQVPIKSINEITNQNDVIEGVTYFDGLGRTIKSIAIGQSPKGNDIIGINTYDVMGRQAKQYLPYASKINGGSFNNNPNDNNHFEVTKFYEDYLTENGEPTIFNNVIPYSETMYRNTPANIPLRYAAQGNDWKMTSGHEIEYSTGLFNEDEEGENEVRKYKVTYTANSLTTPILVSDGFYAYKTLEKSIITNEHGVKTESFTNKSGQIVLTRRGNQDTYTVYDDYGNISFVIPPKVNTEDGISAIELSELCYQYIYTGSGRLIEKKDPGKGWENIIYNYYGQPILIQSASLKAQNKWLFTKYDFLGRILYTGIYTDSRNRSEIQAYVNDLDINSFYETKTNTPSPGFQNQLYYTNTVFPTLITELHTINYYDNYTFDLTNKSEAIAPSHVYGKNITDNTQDFATGSKTKILGTDQWITSVLYYDTNGNSIYSFSNNPYLETTDAIKLKIDFAGKILKSRSYHKKGTNNEIVTQQTYTYDHSGRLLHEKQCIGDNTLSDSCGESVASQQNVTLNSVINDATEVVATESILFTDGFEFKATASNAFIANIKQEVTISSKVELIASNQYNELGQLKTKKVGNTAANSLQDIDYKYNIRGWLTHINDPNESLGDDLFGYKISYTETDLTIYADNKVGGQYDGNIAATHWKTANDSNIYSAGYFYDNQDRLSSNLNFKNKNLQSGFLSKGISYDKNGNIVALHRGNHQGLTIDVLKYTYDSGNKLLKVKDEVGNPEGFKDGSNPDNDYAYDIDGNMTQDLNKGITKITYNHLDLPTKITVVQAGQTSTTQMVYSASGDKLSKTTTVNNIVKVTKYAGIYVYTDNNTKPEYIHFSEGYIEPKNTTGYQYIYQYKDHLGNVRLSYSDDNGDGNISSNEIREEKHYYAFGLQHTYASGDPRNVKRGRNHNYGFNGIELNNDLGVNLYEMPLRSYDPSIGRWTSQDPVVHHMYSPYNAFDNNPIYYADPSGADGYSPYRSTQDYFGNLTGNGYNYNQTNDQPLTDDFYNRLIGLSGSGSTIWLNDNRIGFYSNGAGFADYRNGIYDITHDPTVALATVGISAINDGNGNISSTRGTVNSALRQIKNNIENGFVQDGYSQGQRINASGISDGSGFRYIPGLGNGLRSYDWFARGDINRGLLYAGLAISDVFAVKALVTSSGRLIAQQASKRLVTNFADNAVSLAKSAADDAASESTKLLTQGMVPNAGGVIVSFTTKESSTFYRVYSSNPNGGAFLTKVAPKSSAFAREGLALPSQYNTATHIQKVTVPAGVTLQRSRALSAFGGRGGLEQFQILNFDSRIIFHPGVPLR